MDLANRFYKEWFTNQSWWFNATVKDDIYITNTYERLLDLRLNNISISIPNIYKVIIWDQLPRHVFRNQDANHIIEFFLQKALEIVISIAKSNEASTYSLEEWIFFMLPFRHTKNPIVINEVMKLIWKEKANDLHNPLFRRFIKATYERCPMDQMHLTVLYNYECFKCSYKTPPAISIYDSLIYKTFKNNMMRVLKHHDLNEPIIISLSGGVDSMICSLLMKYLGTILNIHWCAVHINYTNRKTHLNEEEFVKKWCQILAIKLYVRRINEINRPMCMANELRDTYETYTRNVRYNTYKVIHKFPTVVMGHNQDDCIENILTNIVQQQKYDCLSGMEEDSYQDGIRFIRPILSVSKSEIYDFAKEFEIDHLPDSTPDWSQRGQIRTQVRPVLEKWDTRTPKGFLQLNIYMKDLHSCMNIVVNNMLKKTINGVLELEESTFPEMILVWRTYFLKFTNITVSYSSLKTFLWRVSMLKENENKNNIVTTKIPLSKDLTVTIKKIDKIYNIIFS